FARMAGSYSVLCPYLYSIASPARPSFERLACLRAGIRKGFVEKDFHIVPRALIGGFVVGHVNAFLLKLVCAWVGKAVLGAGQVHDLLVTADFDHLRAQSGLIVGTDHRARTATLDKNARFDAPGRRAGRRGKGTGEADHT